MTLLSSLKTEFFKQKRRRSWLLLLVPLAVELFVMGSGFDTDKLSDGWMMQFFYMPLTNGMCLPVMLALYASRLTDIEHRGDCFKTLYTVMPKRTVFFTKLLYGLGGVALMCIAESLLLIIIGKKSGFGAVPAKDMLFWTLSTLLAAEVLYWLQLILSYFIKNQTLSICVGVVGSMAGMFLMFVTKGALLRIIPWGLNTSALFVSMDYNDATNEMTFTHLPYPGGAITACVVWFALLLFISFFLIERLDTEPGGRKEKASRGGDAFHRMPVEWLKLKGSPAWVALFLLPLVSSLIGTFNYKMNIEVLQDGWYDLWSQHTLFLSFLFLPVAIGIFVGSSWRVEHTGANWNMAGVLVKPLRLIAEKYLTCLAISWAAILWTTVLYMIAGKLAGIPGELPKELTEWVLLGMLGAAAICSAQTFLSVCIHSFMIPVGISCAGGFAGLMMTAKNIPYILPWSLMSMGLRANNPRFELNCPAFFAGVAINTVLWLAAALIHLKRADFRTNE